MAKLSVQNRTREEIRDDKRSTPVRTSDHRWFIDICVPKKSNKSLLYAL